MMNLDRPLMRRPLMSNTFGDPAQTRALTNPSITAPLTNRSITSSSSAETFPGQTPDAGRNRTSSNQQTRMETGRHQKTRKAQANAQAEAEAQSETEQPQPATTVMIRNIPRQNSTDELVAELFAELGRSDIIDFFYLPWEMTINMNRGYAFVNFVDAEKARMALESLVDYKFKSDPSHIAFVAPARMQGLECNMRFYLHRAVGNRNHPCPPLVMCNGRLTELSGFQFGSYRENRKMSDVLEASTPSFSSLDDDKLRICEATGEGKGKMSTWKGEGKGAGKSSENWVATSGNISQLPTCVSESDMLPMIRSLESLPSMGSIPELSLAHTSSLTSSFPFSRMSAVSAPVEGTFSRMSAASAGSLEESSTVNDAGAIDIVIDTTDEDVLSQLLLKFGTPEEAGTANLVVRPRPQDA